MVIKNKLDLLMFNIIIYNPLLLTNWLVSGIILISIYSNLKQNFGYNKPFKQGIFFYEYQYLNTMIYVSMFFTLVMILVINRHLVLRNQNLIMLFTIFAVILFYLVFTYSILMFFITYELLLFLTAFIVYKISPNIRSQMITLYFLFWTQLSSLFLWISILIIYIYTKSFVLNISILSLPKSTFILVKYLLFISFSIKLPLWPFSFWLIKTHVEANTSFSIFLSGVLVKTALVGLLKFHCFFIHQNNTIIIYIILISIIFTTLAMGIQVDLKKLIAYATTQEMSLILFFVIYTNFMNLNIIVYFVLLHTLNSLILFFLNDLIYIRFKTRRTKLCLGIGNTAPKLNVVIIIVWFLLTSIPLSFKFLLEVIILVKILSLPSLIVLFFIFFLQLISIVFLTINIVPYIFGNGYKTTFDISKTELLIIIIAIIITIYLIF